ncbi:MAG: hypothetical protein WA252_18665 [Candidatus Sulfotelmatobacter sp.]
MSRFSPTLEGFRIAWRRPSLSFAEIAWRWSVGLSAALLFAFALINYLDTIPVSSLEAGLLATRMFVWPTLMHIFRGSFDRAMLAALVGFLAVLLLWIAAASVAQLAIVRAVVECCRTRASGPDTFSNVPCRDASNGFVAFRSLAGLYFLRATATLAALFALLGAAIVANFVSPEAHPQTALGLLTFMLLVLITAMAWAGLNWLLSYAAIFVVLNGEDATGAISVAIGMLDERLGPVLAVGTWNLLAHLTAFVGAAVVASVLLGFITIVPATLVIAGIILVALVYFAVVDWLYVARLAGYIFIAEMPGALAAPAISNNHPSAGEDTGLATAPETAVDRDEPILSDLPGMAFQLAPQS